MSNSALIVTIEFYDNGIRICDEEKILADSPSYALIDSNQIIVGETAKQKAYLRPREICTHYWTDLTAKSTTKFVISHVEIALKHLEQAWQQASCHNAGAILITNTQLNKNDLGLLLGICNKLNIHVLGITCNAVLAFGKYIDNCSAVYLDLLQNKLVFNELQQNEKSHSIKNNSRALSHGLQNFIHSCAKSVANKFVIETRFDPFHSASNEQQLYDQLTLWMDVLQQQETIECLLTSESKQYGINLQQHDLVAANQPLFNEIAKYLNVLFHDQLNLAIICSPSCKKVFGLYNFLATLPGCAAIQLDEATLSQQAFHNKDEIITSDEIHFIKALPKQSTSTLEFNQGRLSNLANQPSHLLINGHAHSLHQTIYLSMHENYSEPIVEFNKTPKSLCKISSSIIDTKIEAYTNNAFTVNKNAFDQTYSTKINDILEFKDCNIICQFIKVVPNEA